MIQEKSMEYHHQISKQSCLSSSSQCSYNISDDSLSLERFVISTPTMLTAFLPQFTIALNISSESLQNIDFIDYSILLSDGNPMIDTSTRHYQVRIFNYIKTYVIFTQIRQLYRNILQHSYILTSWLFRRQVCKNRYHFFNQGILTWICIRNMSFTQIWRWNSWRESMNLRQSML